MAPRSSARPYRWSPVEGDALPLGVRWVAADDQYNLSLYAPYAARVTIHFYAEGDAANPVLSIALDPALHKSWTAWHYRLDGSTLDALKIKYYGYQVDNPGHPGSDWDKILLDPTARSVFFPPDHDRAAACRPGSNAGKAPLAHLEMDDADQFDWGSAPSPRHESDLVIYELHVKGFTRLDPSVPAERRGTYLGVIDKIPYLQGLGVTAIELLPVYQFDPAEKNYWGYSPLSFFSPVADYASQPGKQLDEFRQMVKACHDAQIEVFLDVVYNHTTEGSFAGPNYSFRGIANNAYYMMSADERSYWDASGTGNSLCASEVIVRRLVLDSMRFWVNDAHVDGFRFDLATVLTRTENGELDTSFPLINEINSEPALANARLIAEAWGATSDASSYQLGTAWPGLRWRQWNGKYRDTVRQFIKGDEGKINDFIARLYGSDDLFPDDPVSSRRAFQSVNFVNCHDGFNLYDLVSYNAKHNDANGEQNRDGSDNNSSWNCGFEGDPCPADVLALRLRQARAFVAVLMLSNGTPMFCAGDEFLNTQGGNNNPYNQDNPTTWLDWSRAQSNSDFLRFFSRMIAFRKEHPILSPGRFWRSQVTWFGTRGDVDRGDASHALAFYLNGAALDDDDLYVMINTWWEALPFHIEAGAPGDWSRVVDTSAVPPEDFFEPTQRVPLSGLDYLVQPRSVVVLLRKHS